MLTKFEASLVPLAWRYPHPLEFAAASDLRIRSRRAAMYTHALASVTSFALRILLCLPELTPFVSPGALYFFSVGLFVF